MTRPTVREEILTDNGKFRVTAVFASIFGIGLLGTATARAGECPKDKILLTPRSIESKASVGVTHETLGLINLKGWRGVGDLFLRTRLLKIAPGGIVPTHNHDDRPALVYIVKGEIIEHNTYCLVPILWKAGEESREFGPGFGHWWENKGDTEVVLTSSDVVDQETIDLDKPNQM
jgi:quercetin dioxygenase-like cupin family protein